MRDGLRPCAPGGATHALATVVLAGVAGCSGIGGPTDDVAGRTVFPSGTASDVGASAGFTRPTPTPETGGARSAAPSPRSPASPTPTSEKTTAAKSTGPDERPEQLSWHELYQRRQELVGRTVQVVGKAFFLERCPPPESASGSCTLTGLLADPDRGDLQERDRDQALALAEDGELLSCPSSPGSSSEPAPACPGWRHATRYQLVVAVQHQVLGGRETEYVQLDVRSRTVT